MNTLLAAPGDIITSGPRQKYAPPGPIVSLFFAQQKYVFSCRQRRSVRATKQPTSE